MGTAGFYNRKCNRLVRQVFTAALFCVFIPVLAAQQQTPVQVSSQRIVEGEIFQIFMSISQVSPELLQIEHLRMPSGLQLIESYAERSSSNPDDSRVVVRLRALRSGFFELPAIRVSASGRELSSGAVLIQVHPSRGTDAPMEAYWEIDHQSPLAGQSIRATLKLRSGDARAFPGAVSFPVPDWGDFRELGSSGSIQSTEYSTGTLYTIPVLSYLFTPMSPGEYTIPAARLGVNESSLRADPLVFDVTPAPAAIQSSLAIGEYFFSVQYSSLDLMQGETFELTFRLEGSGNIPYVQFPEPSVENLLAIGSDDQERTIPGSSGFSGSRSRVFRYGTRDTGSFQITVPGFSWYDPVERRLRTFASISQEIVVRPVPLGESSSSDGRSFAVLDSAEVSRLEAGGGRQRRDILLWLLPVLLAMLARYTVSHRSGRIVWIVMITCFAFPGIRGFDAMLDLSAGEELVHAGDFVQAFEHYQRKLEDFPDLPGLWFNAGITAYRAGYPVEAVYALRKSVLLRPQTGVFHDALVWLEGDQSLEHQANMPSPLSGGSLMVLTLFSLQFMAVLWLFYRVRRLGGVAVLFLFFAICSIAFSIADFQLFQRSLYRSGLIVSDEPAEMYRIPVSSGQSWMQLPQGTAVLLLGQSEDFFLIETGPGLRGWIDGTVLREL